MERIVFLQRIITIDETWARDFKHKLKSQSEVWKEKNSLRPQKFLYHALKLKQMMITAYNYTGVV